MPVLLLVTIMALVAAVGLPFLQIDQFMLKHRSYSVIRSAEALWESGAYVLVSVVVGGLMVMPGLQWFGMVMAWCLRRAPAQRLRWQQAATAFGRWAMLDVFALALFLFLTEGETLIKTEVKTGLYMVVVTATAALAVAQVARLLGGRVARSAEG